jgi:hypothetical protein
VNAQAAQQASRRALTSRRGHVPGEVKIPICCRHTSSSSSALCHSAATPGDLTYGRGPEKSGFSGQKLAAEQRFYEASEWAS